MTIEDKHKEESITNKVKMNKENFHVNMNKQVSVGNSKYMDCSNVILQTAKHLGYQFLKMRERYLVIFVE